MTESQARREALVVMAKAPRQGEVKTRLYGALGPAAATELYRCLLRDTMALMEAARDARPGLSLVLCFAPAGAEADFAEFRRPGWLMIAQRGAHLSARLVNCLAELFEDGYGAVVVMDADSPTLPDSYLLAAFERLENERTVVLGPAEDGGYYLVGVRCLCRQIFEGIPWSSRRVLAETEQRARQAGLEIARLPAWYDVDTPAELEQLAREVEAGGAAATFTRAFFAARGAERANKG